MRRLPLPSCAGWSAWIRCRPQSAGWRGRVLIPQWCAPAEQGTQAPTRASLRDDASVLRLRARWRSRPRTPDTPARAIAVPPLASVRPPLRARPRPHPRLHPRPHPRPHPHPHPRRGHT